MRKAEVTRDTLYFIGAILFIVWILTISYKIYKWQHNHFNKELTEEVNELNKKVKYYEQMIEKMNFCEEGE